MLSLSEESLSSDNGSTAFRCRRAIIRYNVVDDNIRFEIVLLLQVFVALITWQWIGKTSKEIEDSGVGSNGGTNCYPSEGPSIIMAPSRGRHFWRISETAARCMGSQYWPERYTALRTNEVWVGRRSVLGGAWT